MGIVRMGPPEELVLLLKQSLNLSVFVETGTFKGNTAVWAANHFEDVFTIENSQALFDEVVDKYRYLKNVKFLFGDSRKVLKNTVKEIHKPVLFWLDAHWCGIDDYGASDQCPVIEEIKIIGSIDVAHCILIDDARLFLSPPPLPNIIEHWPTIDLILEAIQTAEKQYYIVVFEDVVIAVPENARSLVAEYCQKANTKKWIEHGMHVTPNGIDLIRRGIGLIVRNAWFALRRAMRSL